MPMLYNAIQSVRHPKNTPSHEGIYIPSHAIHVPWIHPMQHSKLQTAVFAQLTSESSYKLIAVITVIKNLII